MRTMNHIFIALMMVLAPAQALALEPVYVCRPHSVTPTSHGSTPWAWLVALPIVGFVLGRKTTAADSTTLPVDGRASPTEIVWQVDTVAPQIHTEYTSITTLAVVNVYSRVEGIRVPDTGTETLTWTDVFLSHLRGYYD